MAESKKYTIKEIFTTLGIIISVFLGGKEAYEYFKSDLKIEGIVSNYQSPPFLLNEYRKSQIYLSVLESIALKDKVFSKSDIDLFIKEHEEMYPAFSYNDTTSLVVSRGNDYKSYWVFTIKNISNKPIEEMILQTDFNGYCKVEFPDKKPIVRSFARKIELGKFNPAQEIIVKAWSDESYDDNFLEYKEINLIHKNGSIDVTFPKEKSRFMKTLSAIPILVYFIFFILFVFIFLPSKKSSESE